MVHCEDCKYWVSGADAYNDCICGGRCNGPVSLWSGGAFCTPGHFGCIDGRKKSERKGRAVAGEASEAEGTAQGGRDC